MAGTASPTVVVTGNASGIGAAIAARLAADGCSVIGIDRTEPSNRADLADHIVVDLADKERVVAVAATLKGASALVHAAGFMRVGSLGELSLADGDAMWAVHVGALTLLADQICPAMPVGGRLVAIGSRTSAGAANKGQYAASKAAMTALVRSWAAELAPRGITANVVAPAATNTPFLAKGDRAAVAPVLPPIGRYIEPTEVAAYVAFLLSEEAAGITGQELLICGGASL